MELLVKFILPIHIIAGSVSLILFWIPVCTKKGGRLHVKSGLAYVYAMWVVVITSIILSVINVFQADYISALFLGFLGLLTANPLWYGISVLHIKKGIPRKMYNTRRILSYSLVLWGIANILIAWYLQFKDGAVLLLIFGVLGISAIKEARLTYEQFCENIDPIKDHIAGMIISGIAAYTAFFAFGGRTMMGEIFTGNLMTIPWVAPTIIGLIAIKWYKKRWTMK